ncbi:MAG: tRNA threonylcarbamoyladenosine dehydratase [Alphaproteobacteria bacterium]|nr:tRNA threonylcarbamoyladenosine dehydratase [Alphaproteobacteria bacterium]
MENRLHRISLLLGESSIKTLKDSSVMVFGCGAVGSFAIESLARSGIGHLILVDFDCVEETNINRQLFALDSTIGKFKTDIAKQRIYDINPDIKVDILNVFFDENSVIDYKPDFVIDAIDTVSSKIALYKWCSENNIPFISSMGAARKTDLTKIKVDKISKSCVCPLASKIRHEIRGLNLPDFPVVYSIENAQNEHISGKEFGSIITVTGTFGLFLADYTTKYLLR